MISTRSVELVIDTVVCLTLAKWETVSGRFGGYIKITSPPTKEIEKHLNNYGNFDNTCIRWTDKCRNCSRSISGDHPVCSNIGIACEPAEVECLERQQDGEKK